jgi:cytochrome b subunit of formate dehydrogenase
MVGRPAASIRREGAPPTGSVWPNALSACRGILIAGLGVAMAVLSITGVVIWWRKLSAWRQTAARRGAVAESG